MNSKVFFFSFLFFSFLFFLFSLNHHHFNPKIIEQTILSIVIPTSIVTLELPHIKKDVIQYLTSLAQESPLQFKSVVASLPQSLKSSLENALTQATQANTPKNNQNTTTNSMKTHQPTIQLKMNFGSFT